MHNERTYIAIDLKSFYASVECMERHMDPLTTNLVVADESRTDKTICLAVSPSLKAYGIPGRARLFEVKEKLKEIKIQTGQDVDFVIAQPQMSRYIQVSADIYAIYLRYVSPDDIHVYSIDECFIDVTAYLELYNSDAHNLAMRMIHEVLNETGITATAGIGSNLYLSKVAMDIVAKHVTPDCDGVRIADIDEYSYRRLLWEHRPLTDFWRIGRGISRKLEQKGIYTMGDIAERSLRDEQLFYHMFGIDAELLIDHAWGYEPCTMADIKAYKPATSSISSGQVLQYPYDFHKSRIIVQEMTDMLALDLVDKDVTTDSLTLTVGYDRCSLDSAEFHGEAAMDRYGRLVPKPAHGTVSVGAHSNSASCILAAVLGLYDRIVSPELMVRRITLCANNLEHSQYEQLDMFTDQEKLADERSVQHALIDIKRKFGKNAIFKGVSLEEGATTIERNNQIGGHKA